MKPERAFEAGTGSDEAKVRLGKEKTMSEIENAKVNYENLKTGNVESLLKVFAEDVV